MSLTFLTPWLLLGLLATFIPLLLHLLARARAQEVLFPSLRFLQMSMEKTARRRRVQHWLLLLLRMLLLALLALAVAQPVVGGWNFASEHAAVIVLDNSLSMAAVDGGQSRFARARADAEALLAGSRRPAVAALLTAGGDGGEPELTARLEDLRQQLAATNITYGPARIDRALAAAFDALADSPVQQKFVYLFTDLQASGIGDLQALRQRAAEQDVHLLVVNLAETPAENVAVTDVTLSGQQVVNEVLEISATVANASPRAREVQVALSVEGELAGSAVRRNLAPAGEEGSNAIVRFYRRMTRPGPLSGAVTLTRIGAEASDALAADNQRHFAVDVADPVAALLVHGPIEEGINPLLAPHAALAIALDPFADPARPWSIRTRSIDAAALTAEALAEADVVFLCSVPAVSDAQGDALAAFVASGGTAVMFCGPASQREALNRSLGRLLPAGIEPATGEVGPQAGGVPLADVDRGHPYLTGIYEDLADYLSVVVQRYYRLRPKPGASRTLMELANGDPLMVVRPFGQGRVLLCATPASPRWSNLPTAGLFPPMMIRAALLSRRQGGQDRTFLPGARVALRPEAPAGQLAPDRLTVTPPGEATETIALPVAPGPDGPLATFDATERIGLYTWRAGDPNAPATAPAERNRPDGAFAVNPAPGESDLRSLDEPALRRALASAGLEKVYMAPSAERAAAEAAEDAQGENGWKYLLLAAVFVLVFESVVANRVRSNLAPAPAHLKAA